MNIQRRLLFVFVLGTVYTASYFVASAAQPMISSAAPNPAHVGETVTVVGSDFITGSRVVLYDGRGTPFVFQPVSLTATQITFVVPVGAVNTTQGSLLVARPPLPGEGDIPNNQGLLSNRYEIGLLDTAPTITSITPNSVRVGETVSVTGTGFDANTTIQFTDNYTGGLFGYWAKLSLVSPTSGTFVVPFGVKGIRTIQAKHTYSGLVSNTKQLTVLPIAPIINRVCGTIYCDVLPSDVMRAGVSESILRGSNLDSDSVIVIDGGTELKIEGTCRTPNGAPPCFYIPNSMSVGPHSMHIRQKDSGLTSNSVSFTVVDHPVLASVYGNLYPGGKVVLRTIGADANSSALIDGPNGHLVGYIVEPTGRKVVDNTGLSIYLPMTVTKGVHTMQVKQSNTGYVSNIVSFTVVDAPAGTPAPAPSPSPTPSPTPTPTPTPSPTNPAILVTPTPTNPATPITPTPTNLPLPTYPLPTNPATPVTPAQSAIAAQIALLRAKIATMRGETTPPATLPTEGVTNAQSCTILTKNLSYKSTDAATEGQVTLFQQFLQNDGYLNTSTFGTFGPATLKATKAFQRTEGINPTGYVGPLTRAKIQALSCE